MTEKNGLIPHPATGHKPQPFLMTEQFITVNDTMCIKQQIKIF